VARGPQIDLLALPAEQNLQRAADTDASAAPFDALPWRRGTPPAGSSARLLAAPAAHDAAAMTEHTIRSAVAAIAADFPGTCACSAGQPPQEIEQALWAVDDDVSRVEQRCRRLG
jgi:hypothetical protein